MKKIFSLLVSLCIVFNLLYFTSYAFENEIAVEFCEGEYFDYSKTQGVFTELLPTYYNKNSSANQDYSSYSLLNDLEKAYYNEVININPGTLSFEISYSPVLSAEDFGTINFTKIMNAIVLDHPEMFYYNGYSYGYSYFPSTGEVISVTYNILCKKNSLTDQEIYTSSNIPSYLISLKNAFDNIEVDTSNRYNFVKSVHDYLCDSVTYINDYGSCHDVYGTLVNKQAVCEGYAEAMKMFCDYYKIPCVLLTGTGNGGPHMWNAVQMDDGYWYLLDITWDDQESYGIYYDFFLVGLNTKDRFFGGYTFNVSHISDGSPYLPVLNFATDKYTETEHNTGFKATYNSRAKEDGKYLIRSYFDSKDTYVYYNGMYVETNNLSTNDVFEVSNGENGNAENWTLVLLGDCNGDGNCDASDYSDAVNKVLSDNGVSNASDMAADLDCDGSLDVIDLSLFHLASTGLNTDIKIK